MRKKWTVAERREKIQDCCVCLFVCFKWRKNVFKCWCKDNKEVDDGGWGGKGEGRRRGEDGEGGGREEGNGGGGEEEKKEKIMMMMMGLVGKKCSPTSKKE